MAGRGCVARPQLIVPPASTVALKERARRVGVGFVDAPVSGGTQRAADATLTIMVDASEPTAFEAAQPLLACLGSQVIHVGGPGAGHSDRRWT